MSQIVTRLDNVMLTYDQKKVGVMEMHWVMIMCNAEKQLYVCRFLSGVSGKLPPHVGIQPGD